VTVRGTFGQAVRLLSRSSWLLAILLWSGCKADPPSPAAITKRAWRAHEIVIAAGENAKTCADAGIAMQAAFAANRQAFVDAMTLDGDKAKLAEATDYIEKHDDQYKVIEARMQVLSDRCGEDHTVAAAFQQMETP
jgi:hypothetical protein